MRRPTRARRSRRRYDTQPVWRIAASGLASLAFVALALYVGLTSYNGVPGRDYGTLYTDVPGVGNLIQHDPVRIAGVRVGQVDDIGINAAGRPRIRLQLEPGTDVPANSVVQVRANGLLGARYVQIVPGTSPTLLRDGATIASRADAVSYGVSDALDTFDPPTRLGLQQTVDGLGEGLLGQGTALNDALRVLRPAVPEFSTIMRAVTDRPGAAERLVPALDALMTPLAARRADYIALLAPAQRALAPFVDRRQSVRDTLAAAPGALTAAQDGLARGRRLLSSVRHLSGAVETTFPTLPRGLRATSALLRETPGQLDRARDLLAAVPPTVGPTLAITRAARPVLKPLSGGLTDAIPILDYIGPRSCDVELFGVTMRSMTGFGGEGSGPLGPLEQFRAQAIIAPESFAPAGQLVKPVHDAYAAPCKYPSKPYDVTGG